MVLAVVAMTLKEGLDIQVRAAQQVQSHHNTQGNFGNGGKGVQEQDREQEPGERNPFLKLQMFERRIPQVAHHQKGQQVYDADHDHKIQTYKK